jgi:hypothetical protein
MRAGELAGIRWADLDLELLTYRQSPLVGQSAITGRRNFKPGTWASLDANFWWGGVTSLSGIQNLATKQTGSRIGATMAWRDSRHQSLKVSYSDGTYIRFGGNYQAVQVGWQYSWLGWQLR